LLNFVTLRNQSSVLKGNNMDLRKLKTLIDLVAESGVSELEISEGEERVRIVNHRAPSTQATQVFIPQQNPVAASNTPAVAPSAPVAPSLPEIPSGHVMKSPMVGTFYRAQNPESPEFVRLGDTVKAGQTLCIIEAMKLLNEIEADVAGVIKEICVVNGQGVEYDQPLFIIG
jgi:acetyl-CoA carboxylase biotin carboxyl carrier protein